MTDSYQKFYHALMKYYKIYTKNKLSRENEIIDNKIGIGLYCMESWDHSIFYQLVQNETITDSDIILSHQNSLYTGDTPSKETTHNASFHGQDFSYLF